MREDALADVGLAWPQMRRMLAELGGRLVAAGRITVPEDVYWLRPEEIAGEAPGPSGAVAERKALWRGRAAGHPAADAPAAHGLGPLRVLVPGRPAGRTGRCCAAPAPALARSRRPRGCWPARPTSAGCGPVTCSSRASPRRRGRRCSRWPSAVVTDVGGPLSHSSIVAREYGIPAVLGTGVATRRIPDGAHVRVDGDAGTVTLLDEAPAAPVVAAPTKKPLRLVAVAGGAALALGIWLRRRARG